MESGKQRLDCACAVGLGFRPLVFNLGASIGALCFFSCFLESFGPSPGPQKVQSAKVGGGACTQLFDFKNKALVYLYLRPSMGTSTGSLVGRPSTRGRIYVAFGEHPAAGGMYVFFWVFVALCKALWCLFSALGGFLAPLLHLGLPF